MSHVKTFDDKLLSDALTYLNVAIKKLEALEAVTPYSDQALSLLEYAKDEIVNDMDDRYERRRGAEEAYRWRIMISESNPSVRVAESIVNKAASSGLGEPSHATNADSSGGAKKSY